MNIEEEQRIKMRKHEKDTIMFEARANERYLEYTKLSEITGRLQCALKCQAILENIPLVKSSSWRDLRAAVESRVKSPKVS